MAGIVKSRLAFVKWHDKDSVIDYAKKLELGESMTVYKLPVRANYNICHTANEKRLGIQPEWVVYRTRKDYG